MAEKINPAKRPATGADVKRALARGVDLGVSRALRMALYIMLDKHGLEVEDVRELAQEINWLAHQINDGRISWTFVDKVLSENGVEVALR